MLEFFKKFMPYMKGYYLFFFISIVAGLVAAGCTAWVSYLIKPLLDGVFIFKNISELYVWPMLLVVAYLGKAIGSYAQTYFMGYIGEDIVKKIRNQMLSKMLELDLSFFNKNRNGELMARITNDIGLVRSAVSTIFTDLIREGATSLALVFVVIYQSPKLALVGLVIIPLAILPLSLIVKKLKKLSKKAQEKNADITARLSEIFNNIEVIKTSNGGRLENQRFQKENEEFFKINMKNFLVNNLDTPVMEILGALAVGGVIFIGGKSVIEGQISTGEFVSFSTALFMLYTPIKRLINAVVRMQSAIVASDRIDEVMRQKPSIVDGNKVLEAEIESITMRDVSFGYENYNVLHHINLEIKKNQIVAFVGKSGSGKSSLISLLLRLYDPRSGEILINQESHRNFTLESLRQNFALVNQRIFIFNDSVAQNVAYGLEVDTQKVIWALKQAMIWEDIQKLPQGIETQLDEFGVNLSGGQRQRIAIARALYRHPQVLILDEATSALDSKTEEAFKDIIESVAKDRIVIIVAHRPSTIELADVVYRINGGKISLC